MERLSGPGFSRVKILRQRHPSMPLVLVPRKDPENLRNLKDVQVCEVVWIRSSATELPPAIELALRQNDRLRLRRVVTENPDIPPLLERALVHLLDTPHPVASQKELAAIIACDPTTLRRQWKETFGAAGLSLKDLLDWNLLVHVAERPRAGSWAAVAQGFGFHRETLARISRRLTSTRLRDLEERGVLRDLAERFEELFG